MFVTYALHMVKEVVSFQGLGQLMGTVQERMDA